MADARSTLSRTSVSVLLAAALSGGLVSCATDDYAPDGNIFLSRRAPRYGHGGTENPRYRYGANREDDAPEVRTRRTSESRDNAERDAEEPRRRRRSEERSEPRRNESRDDDTESRDRTPPERDREPEREREPERDRGSSSSSSQPTPDPEPPKPKPKPPTEDVPYATPVPGSDGVVYSPYTNQKVDVKGLPPGSKARDPVSKKVFRVP